MVLFPSWGLVLAQGCCAGFVGLFFSLPSFAGDSPWLHSAVCAGAERARARAARVVLFWALALGSGRALGVAGVQFWVQAPVPLWQVPLRVPNLPFFRDWLRLPAGFRLLR